MRGFSDEEREAIREQLVESGREQFLRYGPDKTNVADITDPVGIAKSTFYQFFDSKSELYFEVFIRERDEFLDRLLAELDDVDDAETGVTRLFEIYLDWIENSPLMQMLIDEGEYESVFREVPDERMEREQEEALGEMLPFVLEWQASGDMRDVDPEVFLGTMGSVALLALHREEFDDYGEGMYAAVRDLLVESLARGLTTGGE